MEHCYYCHWLLPHHPPRHPPQQCCYLSLTQQKSSFKNGNAFEDDEYANGKDCPSKHGLILTIKSRESVISVAGVCGTFHPELPPLLALIDGGLDVVEPVSDPLLQPQVHAALRLLADADGEVAPLVQERHGVNVGQLHLQIVRDILMTTVTVTG